MNIYKRVIFISVVMLSISLLASCGSDADSGGEKTYKIKASHTTQEGSNMDDTYQKFKEVVEDKSDGQIEVEVYPSGQLAPSDEDTLKGIMSGSIEVGSVATLVMSDITPEYKIFDFPYLFDLDSAEKFTEESDIYEEMKKDFEEETGVYVMSNYALGPYATINSENPIEKPSDFEGIKIRTPQASVVMDTFETLGASPTPVEYGEVFNAIQQGVVDGVMTTGELIYSDKFYENAKYFTDLEHNVSVHPFMINQEFLDELPKDLQETVLDSAEEATDFGWENAQTEHDKVLDKFEEEGVEVTDLSSEQIEEFEEAVQPAIDKNIDDVGEDFYEDVEKELEK